MQPFASCHHELPLSTLSYRSLISFCHSDIISFSQVRKLRQIFYDKTFETAASASIAPHESSADGTATATTTAEGADGGASSVRHALSHSGVDYATYCEILEQANLDM